MDIQLGQQYDEMKLTCKTKPYILQSKSTGVVCVQTLLSLCVCVLTKCSLHCSLLSITTNTSKKNVVFHAVLSSRRHDRC